MKYLTIFLVFTFTVEAKILSYQDVQKLSKDILVENSMGLVDLNIGDIEEFCPKYNSLNLDEKETFFAHLVTGISQFESDFNPDETFEENNGNISAGLLQISSDSISEVYRKNGCINITSTNDLKDPIKNLTCGFAIIKTLIKFSGYLAKSNTEGASAYWSTLRTPYQIYIKSINKTVTVGKKDQIIAILKKNDQSCF